MNFRSSTPSLPSTSRLSPPPYWFQWRFETLSTLSVFFLRQNIWYFWLNSAPREHKGRVVCVFDTGATWKMELITCLCQHRVLVLVYFQISRVHRHTIQAASENISVVNYRVRYVPTYLPYTYNIYIINMYVQYMSLVCTAELPVLCICILGS